MKKALCLGLIFALLANTTLMASAQSGNMETNFIENLSAEENVLYISDSSINTSTNFEELKDYIRTGGIIVVKHETSVPVLIGDELGMALNIAPDEITDESQTSKLGHYVDPGVDVATLYYEYGNGLKGTYQVNVGSNNTDSADSVIADVIAVIRDRQANTETTSEPMVVNDEFVYATHLDTLDTVTVREPKGTLNASYKLYSLEDYFGEDFYIVKAKYDGTPGCVLSKTNSAYESKYQGEWLYTSIGTPTTSVNVDAYGPYSTIDSTSYSVDISGSIDSEKVKGISGGFSWSRSISDVDITANRLSDFAEWDIDLSYDAHKSTFTFEPAATFDCPTGKASVNFDVYAAYTLDALTAFEEDIVVDEVIICTISTARFQ